MTGASIATSIPVSLTEIAERPVVFIAAGGTRAAEATSCTHDSLAVEPTQNRSIAP